MDKTKMKKVETFASIFGDDDEATKQKQIEGTMALSLDALVPFKNHPFKLYEGDRLNDIV